MQLINALSSALQNKNHPNHHYWVKVEQYMHWLTTMKIQSVLLISSPCEDSLCLCYALIILRKTYIPLPVNISAELLHRYMQVFQVDLLCIQADLPTCHSDLKNQLQPGPTQTFFHYRMEHPCRTFCLLPGIVFFTSGTSDLPKAVHYGYSILSSYLTWCLHEFQLTTEDKLLFITELAFVAALRPLLLPVIAGCRIDFLKNYAYHKIKNMVDTVLSEQVTVFNMTPSLFKLLLSQIHTSLQKKAFSTVRLILLSGEPINTADINYWFTEIKSDTVFYNLYGATEYLVPFYKKIITPLSTEERLDLGMLRSGCEYKLIIDSNEQGYQLCIAGAIANGYLEPTGNTNNIFWFQGTRFIKSHDFVVQKQQALFFYAREKRIIKKYGCLINLDQIESILKKYWPNLNFMTTFEENQAQKVYVFILGLDFDPILLDRIKVNLKKYLPNYMTPDEYIFTKTVPMTASGKIDYRSVQQSLLNYPDQDIVDYFRRFFDKKPMDFNTQIIHLGLESIDYLQMAEHFFITRGQWLDITRISENTRILDIPTCFITAFPTPKLPIHTKVRLNLQTKAYYAAELNNEISFSRCLLDTYPLKGNLDVTKLQCAVKETLANHFMLSSCLRHDKDNYFFVESKPQKKFILHVPNFLIKFELQRRLPSIHSPNLVKIYLHKHRKTYYLHILYHHISLDGWSVALLREEIFRRYAGHHVKSWERGEEIAYLNQANQSRPDASSDLPAFQEKLNSVRFADYDNLYKFYSKKMTSNETSLTISVECLNNLAKIHHLNSFSNNTIFAFFLYQIIAAESGVKRLCFLCTLSNRYSPVPHINELVTYLSTGLPIFIDGTHQNRHALAKNIQEYFTLCFKNMDFSAILNLIRANEKTQAIFAVQNKYTVAYSYIHKIINNEYIQDKYINWEEARHYCSWSRVAKRPAVYLRVYDLGSKFILILNTQLKKGLHQKLAHDFKKIFGEC